MHQANVGPENVKDLGQKLCRHSEQELVLRRICIYFKVLKLYLCKTQKLT